MDQLQQHRVYLAVPGPNICWGTVTGVIRSTEKHIALPYNGGFGFSGVEDFNILWADAHNLYDRGEITHFSMLHGDITPDAGQHWLDILLEEMDSRGASLVSAISPIKDHRGLTSSGICDLADPWRPFRRFTVRELSRLPETFDAAGAGYPDRPLLHNTGLWVCDLRRECFHATTESGVLDSYFRFPTRAIRGTDGAWMHQRESEDWLFSRELWLRGVRDTFITRRIKLAHHGKMSWANSGDWGHYTDGDEDTADKWRPEKEAKPLALLQIMNLELGSECNLGRLHPECPNRNPDRWAGLDTRNTLDDETIVRIAVEAYHDLGFTGMVGFAYYNEPTLQAERMFAIIARIREAVPTSRFILWTNGTLIPEECEAYKVFAQIVVSGYNDQSRRGVDRLAAKGIPVNFVEHATLDTRLIAKTPADPAAPCLRPFVELIIDAHGNSHLCCYDWQGHGTLGNVFQEPFARIAGWWREQLPKIAGPCMAADAPTVCRNCGYRWSKYQCHDEGIVERARRFRANLAKQEAPP